MHPSPSTSSADGAAFDVWARSAGVGLRRALVSRYGVEVGPDVHAEAMAYAWEHWTRVQAMGNPLGYLYRVGQSAARRHPHIRTPPMLPPEPGWERYGPEPSLDRSLQGLTPEQRVAVVLVHGYGCSYAETAQILDVPVSSVRNYVHRGMARLPRADWRGAMTVGLEERLAAYAREFDAVSERPAGSMPLVVVQDSQRRGASRRARRASGGVAVAAAAAAIVVLTFAPDDAQVVDTRPSADAPVGADPAGLPGYRSAQGQPDEIARAYLVDRIGLEVTVERMVPEHGQAASLVGYRWSFRDRRWAPSGGIVVLRKGPSDWWDIVEAVSDGPSIDTVSRARGKMTVVVGGPEGGRLRVTLADIGDNVLDERICTTSPCTSAFEVADVPILVRLQLLDDRGPVTLEERRVDPNSGGSIDKRWPSTTTTVVVP